MSRARRWPLPAGDTIGRVIPLALCVVLIGLLMPAGVRAADPWTVTANSDRVAGGFLSQTGSEAHLYLENHVSIELSNPVDNAILDALGFSGSYSQEISWTNDDSGPAIGCASGLTDLFTFCTSDAAGGWAIVPDGLRLELVLSGTSSGSSSLEVRPGMRSLAYDCTFAAINIALETLADGIAPEKIKTVADLAVKLMPEASGMVAALKRVDFAGAGREFLTLAWRAMKVILDHAASFFLGKFVDLIPGALEVRFGLAVSKATLALLNLDTHLMTDNSDTVVTVGYSNGSSGPSAGTSVVDSRPSKSPHPSSAAPVVVAQAPAAPKSVTGTLDEVPCPTSTDTCDKFDFTWSYDGAPADGFHIYRSPSKGECIVEGCTPEDSGCAVDSKTLYGTVPSSVLTFDATVESSYPYDCWWVSAYNAAGESALTQLTYDVCDSGCVSPGPTGWQTFDEGTYVVDYPGEPTTKSVSMSETSGLYSLNISYYSEGPDSSPQLVYLVEHYTLSSSLSVSGFDYMTLLEAELPYYTLSGSGMTEGETEVTLDGQNALEITISGNGVEGTFEILMNGSDLYVLGAAHQDTDSDMDAERFFDSFHAG